MSEWIKWNGGQCPVDGSQFVDVKLRSLDEHPHELAKGYSWKHYGNDGDIIAYRLAESAAPDQPDLVNAPPHYNTDEALDEFADLMELWLQRRARGETPYHIKTAIMAVIKEIAGQ